MRLLLSLATVLCLFGTARADLELIQIPTDDKPLQAALYKPAGNGPFPVIIALHGCNGLQNRPGAIRELWDSWGRRLSAEGFAVLFPDSYSARGVSSKCRDTTEKGGPDRDRVADILAARDWVQQQDFARKDRIALLGWDTGAMTILWAVRPNLEPSDDRPDFRSAAILYPNCQPLSDTAWSGRIPTLILIGALDQRTPAKACEQMVAGARGRSARAVIVKYRGARHAFDYDKAQVRNRRGVTPPPKDKARLALSANEEARTDAFKRIPEWFAR